MNAVSNTEWFALSAAVTTIVDKLCANVTSERRATMVISLSRFVVNAAAKYACGQAEHGGDIIDCCLSDEIRRELLDLFWYNEARPWQAENVTNTKPFNIEFNDPDPQDNAFPERNIESAVGNNDEG